MNNNCEGVTFREDAGKPDAPKKSSFATRFLIAFFVYLTFVLIPMYVGFGVDVKNMWGIVIPSLLFSFLMALGATK